MQTEQHLKRRRSLLDENYTLDDGDENCSGEGGGMCQDAADHHSHDDGDNSTLWGSLLADLRTPIQSDILRECEGIDLERIIENAEQYLSIADEKLHVFPFKDVSPCWHRLYTDTSMIKAIRNIQRNLRPDPKDVTWLDETIHTLDMAMIMSGGFGRTEMLEKVYEELERIVTHDADHECRQPKRYKEDDMLPVEEHSMPIIASAVRLSLSRPSLTEFQQCMHDLRAPVLLTDVLDTWPALDKWRSKEFWKGLTLGGRRLVPVEVGRSYVDDDWGQRIIPVKDFLDDYIINEKDQKGYLAQYDLFHHLPELNKDIATPDYCFLDAPPPRPDDPVAKARMKGGLKNTSSAQDEVQRNIWFGPPWTISPLHHDPYHNILCQVVGKKYVRLYSPGHSSRLHPRREDEPAPHGEGTIDMSNTSSVDIAAMELSPNEDWNEKWPDIDTVPYQEIILEPGQALYIPVGWWHYVRSCSVGISVSFWWS